MEFYKYNKKYNSNDFKIQIKNVQIIDLSLEDYEKERKPQKLKYFIEPQLNVYPLDLNKGYENYRFRKMDVIYGNTLNKVLRLHIKQKLANSHCNESDSFNVYTHRQAIINIIKSHSYKRDSPFFDWNLYVTKFGNNLYIYSENDDNQVEREAADNIIQSYHYKLEQLLFSDSPNNEPKTDEPIDENIRLNGIYRCQLGKFNLIYSAEVQGIISNEEIKDLNNMNLLNKCRFVNTKITHAKKYNIQIVEITKYFQNYLANVDVTYYAFRDKKGYVREPIRPFKTSEMCTEKSWNPKEYEQFLYDFLSLIVKKMSRANCLETTYEFKYCSKDKAVICKIHEGRTDKSFLSDDYINFIKQKNKFE